VRRVAARNNAAWCDAVVRSHGLGGRFDDDAWTCPQRTPPYYPDAVTLVAEVDVTALLARIDTESPGCSVKDSFAAIDLSAAGFEVLFDAEWIASPASVAPVAPDDGFTLARSSEDDSIATLASIEGQFILNRAAGAVGVSNVVAAAGAEDAVWRAAIAWAARLFPGLPVVGYESGDDLAAPLRHGFRSVGPLRVWLSG
jgi:hypothetical protein